MGFFPIDAECANYLRATGRPEAQVRLYEDYYQAQGLWGVPQKGDIDYSQEIELDLGTGGPKRGRPETAPGPHRAAQPAPRILPGVSSVRPRLAWFRQDPGGTRPDGQGYDRQGAQGAGRRRLRGHRGHHELHQYVESKRDDRGGPAGTERGGQGA